ncbi:MAG: Rrf2 family transcriptional regulator [Candidatus Lernaella stagnicola]|nr:Rrf2 family transcriptional regulator [Candidatus Lernaella stagnicola]
MAIKISTKGRYGLRALIDLAMNSTGRPILLGDIANRQGISKRYLERLFTQLRSGGVIRSVRGASGGYILNREPKDIRVSEVVEILEGPIKPVDCITNSQICTRQTQCVTHALWEKLGVLIREELAHVTLEELRAKQVEISDAEAGMYYI